MEGPYNLNQEVKFRPTDGTEGITLKNRQEKTEGAQISVKRMFDEKMEAETMIRKIVGNPYFNSERD